jgi:hypothetical protein
MPNLLIPHVTDPVKIDRGVQGATSVSRNGGEVDDVHVEGSNRDDKAGANSGHMTASDKVKGKQVATMDQGINESEGSNTLGPNPAETSVEEDINADDMRAVCELSTILYVSEYVKMQGFAPAASSGHNNKQTNTQLQVRLEKAWREYTGWRNRRGEVRESTELALAFTRQIVLHESAHALETTLQAVKGGYARARWDVSFWADFAAHVRDIFAEWEARRQKKAKWEVMSAPDVDRLLELPRLEDAMEALDMLRCWCDGYQDTEQTAAERFGEHEVLVARLWRERNAGKKKATTSKKPDAGELARTMHKQVVACDSVEQMDLCLARLRKDYRRAWADQLWWNEFSQAILHIRQVSSSIENIRFDLGAIVELPRVMEAIEYTEVVVCWYGCSDAHREAERKKIGDWVARQWIDHHASRPPGAAMLPWPSDQAERLATVLTSRIAFCESLDQVFQHILRVKSTHTRRNGEHRWWASFSRKVLSIFTNHARARLVATREGVLLKTWERVMGRFTRLSDFRDYINVWRCFFARDLGGWGLTSRSQSLALRAEELWLKQDKVRTGPRPLVAEGSAQLVIKTFTASLDGFLLCMPDREADKRLQYVYWAYQQNRGDDSWWMRPHEYSSEAQRAAEAAGVRMPGRDAGAVHSSPDVESRSTSAPVPHTDCLDQRGTVNLGGVPVAAESHELLRLALLFRPEIRACQTIPDLAEHILMATILALSHPKSPLSKMIKESPAALIVPFVELWSVEKQQQQDSDWTETLPGDTPGDAPEHIVELGKRYSALVLNWRALTIDYDQSTHSMWIPDINLSLSMGDSSQGSSSVTGIETFYDVAGSYPLSPVPPPPIQSPSTDVRPVVAGSSTGGEEVEPANTSLAGPTLQDMLLYDVDMGALPGPDIRIPMETEQPLYPFPPPEKPPTPANDPIQITVTTEFKRDIVLHVQASDTIGSVKSRLQERVGLAPATQRLSMGKLKLKDNDSTLSDYDIQSSSTLYLKKRKAKKPRTLDRHAE